MRTRSLSFMVATAACFPASQAVAQNTDHCWIKYLYDAAGNRIERNWWCGDPNEADHDADPKMMAQNTFGLHLAPNPAKDAFSLFSETPLENVAIELVDSEGRPALRTVMNGSRCEVDVSTLPPGIYLVVVRSGQVEYQSRVVVAR